MVSKLWTVFTVLQILSKCQGSKQLDDDIIDSCQLEPTLVPTLYDLNFDLDYPQKKFNGEVTITGSVLKNTKFIALDSGVNVDDVKIFEDNGLDNGVIQINQGNKTLQIELESSLEPNKEYKLWIQFSGDIQTSRGIYGRDYPSSVNGESRYFVATEFQPNYASYGFPCVDRPAYKAHFLVNVSRETDQVALSNMPLASSQPDYSNENKVWDSFEKTPRMSTYTFAFVIGYLVPVTQEDDSYKHPINNTIWVTEGNERLAALPARWAPIYMKNLEMYTGIPYSLPKMDHVALPYLASTAMEHWGIITYKQEVLLLEENNYTVKSKFGLIWIMAHEMIHQWFGNLVTCSSWAYTWLNEGITSFLHFVISGKVFPEWDMLGLMVSEEVLKVMDDEGFSAVSLTKDSCVMKSFDTFSMASYYKGAAIMRMVYFMLGEDAVQNGLRKYLKANQYGSVTQEDLWIHFEEFAKDRVLLPEGVTLTTVMETWSNNSGFPMISVTRHPNSIKLKQTRLEFFNSDDLPDQHWWIPLSYTTSMERNFSKTIPRAWMDPDALATELEINISNDDWILFNIEQSGYYRVLYDGKTWGLLSKELMNNLDAIPPLNRAKLIDDVFTLAFYKKLPYSTPLSLAKYLFRETHYFPWAAGIHAFEHIHFYLKTTEINDKFQKFMLSLVNNVYSSLSLYDDRKDSNRDTEMRFLYGKILSFACGLGHKDCETKALDMSKHILEDDNEYISAHLDEIYPLMCTMVRLGGKDIWDKAFQRFQKEKVFKLKDELMESLKCTKDEEVFKSLTRNNLLGEKDYTNIDLFTAGFQDKQSYCMVLQVIQELLDEDTERIEGLAAYLVDLSGVAMPDQCSQMLANLAEKYISDPVEQENIIKSIEKSKKPWIRYKEIQDWFDQETLKTEGSSDESSDTNLIERSLYDGTDDAIDLPPYHLGSPQNFDYESKQDNTNNRINSANSLEFSLTLLIFAVLPNPIYLTYLFFGPFL